MLIPKRQSPSAAGLRGRWCQNDVGHAGLSPQRGHAKVLWLEDGACHSFGCHPTMVIPRRRCREPGSALGELLVRRQGEEAASSKMALTLSASHTPKHCPNPGAGARSSWDIAHRCHSSQKQQGARRAFQLGRWWWQEEVARPVQR